MLTLAGDLVFLSATDRGGRGVFRCSANTATHTAATAVHATGEGQISSRHHEIG
ncbi:MAG: hypothetical protein HZA90_14355 [Verrucomicrobia bacterium]|nr:hypothetical protein [Verrucomicrobiota bacterium]